MFCVCVSARSCVITVRRERAGVAAPLCVLLHSAVQLAVPDLHPMSIWHRSVLALNESRMVKWETKLSIQNHKTAFLNGTMEQPSRSDIPWWKTIERREPWKMARIQSTSFTSPLLIKKEKENFWKLLKIKLEKRCIGFAERDTSELLSALRSILNIVVTQDDTAEEVWCGECLSQITITTYTGAPACGVWNDRGSDGVRPD